MSERNPVEFGLEIETTIRRYLQAALPISHRYPNLKREVEAKLKASELLLKGPYVEALSDFEKGHTLEELCSGEGAFLEAGFSCLEDGLLSRRLHKHQEQALRATVQDKKTLLLQQGQVAARRSAFYIQFSMHCCAMKT